MSIEFKKIDLKRPAIMFAAGWLLLSVSYLHPLGMPWDTFIHFWRVEAAAAIFLILSILYASVYHPKANLLRGISSIEFRSLILPVAALIVLSLTSMFWAGSARSAFHHALVWLAYLTFYLFARSVANSRNNIKVILTASTVVLCIYSIAALSQYLSYFFVGGNLGTGINFQRYGEQATALTPLLLVVSLRQNGKKFSVGVVAIALVWVLILCGLGRMNLLLFAFGLVASTCLIVWTGSFRKYQKKLGVIFATILIIPILFWLIPARSGQGGIVVATRISGTEATASSNDFRKLMAAISLEMFQQNPVLGVGADNFGYELNKYRFNYASRNPDNPSLAQAESEIPERAHNEFLQILAELGLAGGLIVIWLLSGVGLIALTAARTRRLSLYGTAALIGVLIFLASSLVTSFSFRLVQNGFVFFFLLAVCSRYFLSEKGEQEHRISEKFPQREVYLTMGIGCFLLLAFSLVRVSSVIAAEAGNSITDIKKAESSYRLATELDPENPNAFFSFGMRLLMDGRYGEAATNLRNSIDIGRATSTDYSYLASAQSLSGDDHAAIQTIAEAVVLYPRSVFLRVRFASLLKASGELGRSQDELNRALELDRRTANTWWVLMNSGSRAATETSFGRDDFLPLMDLTPQSAVYAVLAERDIRFPGEKDKVPF